MKTRKRRQYGSGNLVPPASPGGTWGIRWRRAKGESLQYKGGFPTRDVAERALARKTLDLVLGHAGLPATPRKTETLGVLAEPFLASRAETHRAGRLDGWRWKKHMAKRFGHLRPDDVDVGVIRDFVQEKLSGGLSSGTVAILVALLSSLFMELIEDGKASKNPCRGLPRSLSRLLKPSHDPKTTPFLERLEDVRRVFAALPEPFNVAFAVGVLAGGRTGEVFALKWQHVDLQTRRIHIRETWTGRVKDGESRMVPILDGLLPILTAWKLKTGGKGLLFHSQRSRSGLFKRGTPGPVLARTLEALGLSRPGLGWYEATRHTFASQWVLAGGSITQLKEILGHYSVVMTERYAHLRPDLFPAQSLSTIPVSLEAGGALCTIPAQFTGGDDNSSESPALTTDGKGSKRAPKATSARRVSRHGKNSAYRTAPAFLTSFLTVEKPPKGKSAQSRHKSPGRKGVRR